MKIRNIILGLYDQLPLSRLLRNIWTGGILGIFHERSHFTHGGKPKVTYGSKATATKASTRMTEKHGVRFSNYKCLFCDGYHIGKSRADRPRDAEGNPVFEPL